MSKRGSTSKSSLSVQEDFLDLCKLSVRSIEKILVNGGNLLNRKQCQDLSSKLSQTTLNIQQLLSYCGGSTGFFRLALGNLYRYLEKAKVLVSSCAEEEWCAAAVFQCQNENAFREILLEVGLCYNVINELAKSKSKDWNDPPQDLRQSSILEPASDSDVDGDKQDLQKRLDEVASGHINLKRLDYFRRGRVARKQSLAKYLLVKMYCNSKEPQANILDTYSALLWTKISEPSGTWGNSRFLGSGSGASGVVSTTWLGIPCAKKEFHGQESESSFMKEAGILAHLKHPCIVNFICCGNGSERGDRFIAMELMEKSLFDLIEEQKQKGEHFSVPVALDMMVQMARGVWYLHGQGVAHRDLKPQNVVVNRLSALQSEDYFCVKLVDFGVSKAKVEVSKSNTMTYRGIGTTMYRAPEAHPKANPDGIGKVNWLKADAFSFAMTCAHLLSLEIPFENMEASKLYSELTKNARRPEVPDMYPQDLVVLLKDCWKTKPRSRPSFMEICRRLAAFRHKFLRGGSTQDEGFEEDKVDCSGGFDFIKMRFDSPVTSSLDDGAEGETLIDIVSIIPCGRGHALEFLPQVPSTYGLSLICNMCWEDIDGEFYYCETCDFHAHPHCAVMRDTVKVFYHDHPLHLLVQNFYNDNPGAICCFCEESVQHSKWVYRCEQCDFDVHASCTKFTGEWMYEGMHPHPLIARQCPPRKSLLCTCCNGEVKEYTWRFTCDQQSCALDLHPLCTTLPWNSLCIFDISHRLSLIKAQRSFHCGRCGALGFSWHYHCRHCDVDIHLDCMDYTDEEDEDWNGAYEKFMVQYENGSKDDHSQLTMILELLGNSLSSNDQEASSSSVSRPSPVEVMTSAQPAIKRPTGMERPALDAFKDVNLRRQIAVETAERIKAKKMAAREARQKWRSNLLEMLENVERIVVDLRSSENMSQDDAEVLVATHEELKRRQHLVKEQIAMQVQSKMSQGPRTAVFFQNRWRREFCVGRELLTRLRAGMKGVCWALLCEEPGHEHIVPGKSRKFNNELGEEMAEKLQPLLALGLQGLKKAMSTLVPQLTRLESVIMPRLEAKLPWDLRPIDFEKHGNQSSDLSEDKEEVEAMKRAADSAAEWFQRFLESRGYNISKTFGLQRVRYKVTEEGDDPKYKRGSLAWLCTDHVNSGLKDDTLESYPLKYYNVEDDYQLRFPHVSPKE